MPNVYRTVTWDAETEADCRWLLRRALAEDLGGQTDWTSLSATQGGLSKTQEDEASCSARIVARHPLVICGLPVIPLAIEVFEANLEYRGEVEEGADLAAGAVVAELSGSPFDLLKVERTILNVMSHLSAIATTTAEYCRRVAKTKARIYDTRKTLPGWRRLQKYAVGQGGGANHRCGLFDGILIKDNHIALLAKQHQLSLDVAPRRALTLAQELRSQEGVFAGVESPDESIPIEIEVDTLAQLENILPLGPDIVLLDNMAPGDLRRAVAMRDSMADRVVLEASGGIDLDTIGEVAEAGVDRISVGALTHSVKVADLALDWET